MKKIADLLNYTGITPVPADLDAYWDEAVLEMKAIDPETELVKVLDLPTVECFELSYTGVGGARIYAKFARPKHLTKPAGAVLMFHGYHACFQEWNRLLVFAGQGLCVAAMDCRGQAGKSQDPGGVVGDTTTGHIIRGMLEEDPRKLMYRSIYLDAAQLADIVSSMDCVDENRLYTFGGSQGGALALVCAALEPRIKKTAAYCPFLCDIQKAYELEALAFSEIEAYFTRTDPRHETEAYVFQRLGYIDVKNLAHRVKAQVKMFTGMKDTSCPPETQFAMYNQLHTEKAYYIYPDYPHADYPGVIDDALCWFLEA